MSVRSTLLRLPACLALGAALCTVLGAAPLPASAEEPGADVFQQSFDREAASDLKDALAALDKLPEARKGSYLAAARRGWLLYRLGRHAESIDAYQKASAQAPKAIESRVGVLLPQMALRRWADVITTAKEVLALDPQNYLASLRMAFACYNLQRYTPAVALYRQLKEQYPSDQDVRSGLGWSLLKQGKTADAEKELRELLSLSPKHALGLQGLAAIGAKN